MKTNYSNYFSTADGEQLFYTTNFVPQTVNKNVLIFNYGLVCSNHHWQYQVEYFDHLGFNILIHDYRGHFSSSGKESIENITFKQLAHDVCQIATHLNLQSSVLIGHSMGVNVCLEAARQQPELFAGLVLISGTVIPVKDVMFNSNIMELVTPYAVNLLKTRPHIMQFLFKYAGWNPITKFIVHKQGFNTKKVTSEFVEIYLNKMGQLGPELFFQLFKELSHHDILAALKSIKTPALVIGGDLDTVIPNYCQAFLVTNLPNSELYIVKDGSHVPQVDYPDHVNERMKVFFSKNLN